MNEKMTVGFIGLGLIGGSIARAFRHYYPDTVLIAHTRSQETMEYALSEGIIDQACPDVGAEFSRCDYIFLCAPVEANAAYLSVLKPFVSPDCILTDVGSTKCDIHSQVETVGLSDHFIGGHPMAGSEKSGIRNSRLGLIENVYYILTPTAQVPREKVETFRVLIASLKAIPVVLDYQEHDYITGTISHLPHLIAAALVNLVHDEDSPEQTMRMLAAGGFKDITRIASSSPEMWEQICATNTKNIVKVLSDYIGSLEQIRQNLVDGNSHSIYELFSESRDYRNTFSDQSSGPIRKVYRLYCDMMDEAGGIAVLSTILASKAISIRNIGIVHNREFEEAVLRVEFYEEESLKKAAELLRHYRYVVYE